MQGSGSGTGSVHLIFLIFFFGGGGGGGGEYSGLGRIPAAWHLTSSLVPRPTCGTRIGPGYKAS